MSGVQEDAEEEEPTFVGKPRLAESRKEKAERVPRYQTDSQAEPVYATRTTKCCGGLEAAFVVLRFARHFLSFLVLLCS